MLSYFREGFVGIDEDVDVVGQDYIRFQAIQMGNCLALLDGAFYYGSDSRVAEPIRPNVSLIQASVPRNKPPSIRGAILSL